MDCPHCGAAHTRTGGWHWFECGSRLPKDEHPASGSYRSARCKYVAGLRDIVEPLEELLANPEDQVLLYGGERTLLDGTKGIVVAVDLAGRVVGEYLGSTLADALIAANNARKESES